MNVIRWGLALLATTLLVLGGASGLAAQELPRVIVVGTGGTIAGQSETRTSFQNYDSGQIPIADMVDELRPQIDSVARVSTVQFSNRGSGGHTIHDYYDLTRAVESALEEADAVVVTSGTSTMDEIVYWLDLTVQSQKPVVITGAMRPWTVIGTDAHANLFNAITLAASGRTYCYGTVLMLNDEFHAAKDVWKGDNNRLDTFVSRQVGILGTVDDLTIHSHRAPPRVQDCQNPERWMTPFDLSTIEKEDLPRVEILMGYQDAKLDEAVFSLAIGGVAGIVTAGGGVSNDTREAVEEEHGVAFVRTQRFRTAGNNMMPQKARLLLMLALAFTDDREQALALYEDWSSREFESLMPTQRAAVVPGGE